MHTWFLSLLYLFGDASHVQILFYANAGTTKEGSSDTGGFVSLYLSCEVCRVDSMTSCWLMCIDT